METRRPHRRALLREAAAVAALAGFSRAAHALSPQAAGSSRRFEIIRRIAVPCSKAGVRVEIPLGRDEVRSSPARVTGNADRIERRDGLVVAHWRPGALAPRLEVVSVVEARGDAPASAPRPRVEAAAGPVEDFGYEISARALTA